MKSIKESKWGYILLSILIAVSFWMYVRTTEDPDLDNSVKNIPVKVTGERVLENQGLMVTSISNDTVTLSWKGPLSMLKQLDKNSVSVTLDLSRISEAGTHEMTYTVDYPSAVTASALSLQNSDPEYITVTVSKIYSKTFDIQAVFRGSVAEGYQAQEFTVSPTTVMISGIEEEVNRIAEVEVVLEREELSKRFADDLPLVLLDDEGNELDASNFRMSIETAFVTLPVVMVKEIPLTIDFIAGGGATVQNISYSIEHKSITVAGAEEDVSAIQSISLGSIDLAQVIGSTTQECAIYLPSGLENVSGITSTSVQVTVHGLTTREFEVDNIQLNNIPEGYNASLSTHVRTIVVRGPEEALDQIYESQLSIVADLSGLSAVTGSYSVPVKVYLSGNSEVGVIGEYTVVVNITKK